MILAIAQGQHDIEGVKSLLVANEKSTKQHISSELQKERVRLTVEDHRRRLLESLYFPEIGTRQEEVKEAYQETFQWIFDDTGRALSPWNSFTEWLREGQGTYWINGKAGSGKSTLMNTIHQDQRTVVALRKWSGSLSLIVPAFFFWRAGSEMQKTIVGLLRALLYQIILAIPSEASQFRDASGLDSQSSDRFPLWTEKRLVTALFHLITDISSSCRLCIFIDGVDEFTGNENELLSLIEKLGRLSNTKICLSSRPSLRFDEKLGSSAMLKLQDLTKSDIESYASAELAVAASQAGRTQRIPDWLSSTVDWLSSIVRRIVDQAEGVFLWVELAVKYQSEGIYNGDNFEQLQQRLDLFPKELEGVYSFMLQQIDRIYKQEAALYFSMAIWMPNLLLRQVALASYEKLNDLLELYPNQPHVELQELCQATRRRITATCKGFLDVQVNPLKPTRLSLSHVMFVHRTAADFLQENEAGRKFLDEMNSCSPTLSTLYIKADFGALILDDGASPSEDREKFFSFLDEMGEVFSHDYLQKEQVKDKLRDLSRCQEVIGEVVINLIELLDQVWSSLDRWKIRVRLENYWCYFWGPLDTEDSRMKILLWRAGIDNLSNDCNFSDDLLIIAASYGLRLYVLHRLDSCPTLQHPWIENYLMHCLLLDTIPVEFNESHIRLASALLRRGASPNAEANATSKKETIWTAFYSRWLSNLAHMSNYQESLGDLFLAFQESGVDLMAGVSWTWSWYDDYSHNVLKYPSSFFSIASLEFRLSPLMFIKRFWPKIADENNLVGRGEQGHSAYIIMHVKEGLFEVKEHIYQLSAQQTERVLQIWKRFDFEMHLGNEGFKLMRRELQEVVIEWWQDEGDRAELQQGNFQEEDEDEDDDSTSDDWDSGSSSERSFHSIMSEHRDEP